MPRLAAAVPEVRAAAVDRILLVDDDELVAGTLRRYLHVRGSACDVASDRDVAARLMAARDYSTVVVDPYLTGSLANEPGALLASIRQLQPRASIVVLTAYESPALTLLGDQYRVTAIVEKPQPIMALANLILASEYGTASPAAQS